MKDFYDFSSKLSSSTFHAYPQGLKIDQNGKDEHWKLVKGEYDGISFPVIFKQESGKKLTDILDTGWPCLYLISNQIKKLLEENRITGWTTYPIKLFNKREEEVSGYYGFSILGRCKSIIYEKSRIVEKQLIPTGPLCKFYKGLTVKGWDGTDFFTPEKTYETFITERVANLLKKHKITNLLVQSLEDYETSVHHVGKEKI